jgi:hypothetical protein
MLWRSSGETIGIYIEERTLLAIECRTSTWFGTAKTSLVQTMPFGSKDAEIPS